MRLREVAPAEISEVPELRLARNACKSGVASDRNGRPLKGVFMSSGIGGRMSKRILVVEDQPDNRQIIRDIPFSPRQLLPKIRQYLQ